MVGLGSQHNGTIEVTPSVSEATGLESQEIYQKQVRLFSQYGLLQQSRPGRTEEDEAIFIDSKSMRGLNTTGPEAKEGEVQHVSMHRSDELKKFQARNQLPITKQSIYIKVTGALSNDPQTVAATSVDGP